MGFHSGRLGAVFLLPIATAGLVMSAGCSGNPNTSTDDSITSANVASSKAHYTGEDLVRAVFFDVGPAAAAIHEDTERRPAGTAGKSAEELATMIDHAAEEMTKLHYSEAAIARAHAQAAALRDGSTTKRAPLSVDEARAAADAVVAHLGAMDPAFFPHIEVELQSGDPLRVQVALDQAAKRIVEAQATLATAHVEDLHLGGPLVDGPVHIPVPVVPPVHVGTILGGPTRVGTDVIVAVDADINSMQATYLLNQIVTQGGWQLGQEQELERELAAGRIAAAYGP